MGNVTAILVSNDELPDLSREPERIIEAIQMVSLTPTWMRKRIGYRPRGLDIAQYSHSSNEQFFVTRHTKLQLLDAFSIERQVKDGDNPDDPDAEPVSDAELHQLDEIAERMEQQAAKIRASIALIKKSRQKAAAKAAR